MPVLRELAAPPWGQDAAVPEKQRAGRRASSGSEQEEQFCSQSSSHRMLAVRRAPGEWFDIPVPPSPRFFLLCSGCASGWRRSRRALLCLCDEPPLNMHVVHHGGWRAVAAREQAASVNVIYTKHVKKGGGRSCCRESVRMRFLFSGTKSAMGNKRGNILDVRGSIRLRWQVGAGKTYESHGTTAWWRVEWHPNSHYILTNALNLVV